MRRVRAFQRLRVRLRRLRKCFGTWAADMQLHSSVLAALAFSGAKEQDGSLSQFVRVRPHLHSSVQTVRPSVHSSLSVVIKRLALRSVLQFFHTWRKVTRCSCALRWGIRHIFARVMRVWTYRPEPAIIINDQDIKNGDFISDDERWQQLISPRSACTPAPIPFSSATAHAPSNNNANVKASTKATASRRFVYMYCACSVLNLTYFVAYLRRLTRIPLMLPFNPTIRRMQVPLLTDCSCSKALCQQCELKFLPYDASVFFATCAFAAIPRNSSFHSCCSV